MEQCLSVLTVNFNNLDGLKKTVQSIENLKRRSKTKIEYIVIDGESFDGSREYVEAICESTDVVDAFVSEPDEGVFDAMNKGVEIATSNWVFMINSGDQVHKSLNVDEVFNNDNSRYSVIYGDWVDGDGTYRTPSDLSSIKSGVIPFCHQACFIRSSYSYDLSYKIYSDYDLVAKIYAEDSVSFKRVSSLFAVYEGGGISSKVTLRKRADKYRSVLMNFGFTCLCLAVFKRFS